MSTALADPVAATLRARWTQVPDLRDRYFPQARPTQQPPDTAWLIWLILAGRGFGKTRTGAEWLIDQALAHPGTRWAVVAPTYGDGRDICFEGESGILAVLARRNRPAPTWNRSIGEMTLDNGSMLTLYSAEKPDRLRGPQHHGAWVDELASFPYPDAWDQLRFGLRLGDRPLTVVTGTPRSTKLIRDLVAREDTEVTRGSTYENAENLAESTLDELRRRYEGTRLGRQELHAEILDDVEGALWTQAGIDGRRVPEPVSDHPDDQPDFTDVVVAVDPAVTSGEDSDESGIVTAAATPLGHCHWCGPLAPRDRHFAVLEDISGRHGTNETTRLVVDTWAAMLADRVVVETNNGGDWIPNAIRNLDPNVVVSKVTATRGKQLRAQPVAALYEQGRVHHVGLFAELEDQMCSWTPDSPDSPDRVDALVWALTDLAEIPQHKSMRIAHVGEAA